MTGEVEEEEGAKLLAEALAPEVEPFSSEEIGKKEFQFLEWRSPWKAVWSDAKNSRVSLAKRMEILGQQSAWQDVLKLSPKLRGRAERILDWR